MKWVVLLLVATSVHADCPPIDTCPWDLNTTHHITHAPATPRPSRPVSAFHTFEQYLDWHTPHVTMQQIREKNRRIKLQKSHDAHTINVSINNNQLVKK